MFFIHIEIASQADVEAQAFQICSLDLAGDSYIIICFHASMDVIGFACSSFGYLGYGPSLDG